MRRRVHARARPSLATIATPRRVLVVEDEFHTAQQIDEILRRMGIQVIGPVGTLWQAMMLAETERIDAALLDVQLQPDVRLPYRDRVYSVADLLRRREIPFSFITAHWDNWIDRLVTDPVLRKPFGEDQLQDAVHRLLRVGSPGALARPKGLRRAERGSLQEECVGVRHLRTKKHQKLVMQAGVQRSRRLVPARRLIERSESPALRPIRGRGCRRWRRGTSSAS